MPSGQKGFLSLKTGFELIDHLGDRAGISTAERSSLKALHGSFRLYSEWSALHSLRVGLLVKGLSESLGYATSDAARAGFCACLHDIGKLAVPISIIDKPGPLTEQELEVVRKHVDTGGECLESLPSERRDLTWQIIHSHHENYDGSGYPDRILGPDIPAVARLVRIVDFFDAVFFDRPYARGSEAGETFALMDQNSHQFEPESYRAFKANIQSINSLPLAA